jgi:hypothetical protein
VVGERFHCTLDNSPHAQAAAYAKWLEASVSDNEWGRIRNATQQGQVMGSDAFHEEMGSQVGRRLNGKTRGIRNGLIAQLKLHSEPYWESKERG